MPDANNWEPACAERHLGMWVYEPSRMQNMLSLVLAGMPFKADTPTDSVGVGRPLYTTSVDGVATIQIVGPMMKGNSKFGGTNMLRTRAAVRAAGADDKVKAVFFVVDSGGGTVAGTEELANDIAALSALKPTAAHIDDLGASAALWVAVQAGRVTANSTALVGSIGVLILIEDTSGKYEADGIKVHVIASDGAGEFKAAGADGTPVTEPQINYYRDLTNATNTHFVTAMAAGRGVTIDEAAAWANGKIYIAADALDLGLIDAVESMDTAMESLVMRAREPLGSTMTGRSHRVARARLRLTH